MNGNLTGPILAIIGGLIALVQVLVGFIVHLHIKSDDEHRSRMEGEINKLRDRLHRVVEKMHTIVKQEPS